MDCPQCKHFIKTHEEEGWCSHPKFCGIVIFSTGIHPCSRNGFVRGSEPPRSQPAASEETPRKP